MMIMPPQPAHGLPSERSLTSATAGRVHRVRQWEESGAVVGHRTWGTVSMYLHDAPPPWSEHEAEAASSSSLLLLRLLLLLPPYVANNMHNEATWWVAMLGARVSFSSRAACGLSRLGRKGRRRREVWSVERSGGWAEARWVAQAVAHTHTAGRHTKLGPSRAGARRHWQRRFHVRRAWRIRFLAEGRGDQPARSPAHCACAAARPPPPPPSS